MHSAFIMYMLLPIYKKKLTTDFLFTIFFCQQPSCGKKA